MSDKPMLPVTVPSLQKKKDLGERIVALTAYDFPTARLLDESGVDVLLVGDSLGMVVLGYPSTIPVTMDEMIHHTKAVVRGTRRALVIGDMPYFSFHQGEDLTIANASRFLKEAGASGVKIEGGSPKRLRLIEAMVEAEIPVMGHVGLTPQSIHVLGQFRVRGSDAAEARKILEDAQNVEKAGAFAVILECVPQDLAGRITDKLRVPTIGIGAGPRCDGQILVFHDLVGYLTGFHPKFVKKYADLGSVIRESVKKYAHEVRSNAFPDETHSYHRLPARKK
ncbi:MAG: 3-methyl-2-oxobutanoate hydroxymethyltransferase [Candidatus Aminicenantes bacterium RBG_16_63_16]|nr:MAG: 3-methyl-2-oxobutanoate hydroxymethyltransferase [Candidatus Aminicenantes bacterium RBG_16_63_16]